MKKIISQAQWGGLNWDTVVIAAILVITATASTWTLTRTIDKETRAIQTETIQIYTKMLDQQSIYATRRAVLDGRLDTLEDGLTHLEEQVSDKSRTINQLQAAVSAESKRKIEIVAPIPVIVTNDAKGKGKCSETSSNKKTACQ